jgi:tetratricopeptide (TPR) repeat protein
MAPVLPLIGLLTLTAWGALPIPGSVQAQDAASARTQRLRAAFAVCDWDVVRRESEALRAESPRGSDGWIEAQGALSGLYYWRFDPDPLERTACDVLAAVVERGRAESQAARGASKPLSPSTAFVVLQTRLLFGRVLQHRRLHDEALVQTRLVLEDLQRGRVDAAQELDEQARLDAARSLYALGRTDEARRMLSSLRDLHPTAREAALATVMLECDVGPSAYRGKYAGDAAHLRRLAELARARVAAAERVAAVMGVDPESLRPVQVGLADSAAEFRGLGAYTSADVRLPEFPPVIVVFSEALALVPSQLQPFLTHEFGHAAAIRAWGMRHEALPSWLAEALARSVAGEIDGLFELLLSQILLADPGRFVREESCLTSSISFETSACGAEESMESGLLGVLLAEGALPRFIAAMNAGKDGAEALRSACGMSLEEYRAAARERVLARLRALRAECLPGLALIVDDSARSATAGLAAAEAILRSDPPPLVRSFARLARAEALAALARGPEAMAAWRELAADPPNLRYAELARRGLAQSLIGAGLIREAVSSLRELQRDALTPETGAWALARLGELARRFEPR